MKLADQYMSHQDMPSPGKLGDLEAWKRGDVNIMEYIDGLKSTDE
jgi:hypothetical protein